MSNFQALEVVGRDSETQFQVGENLDKPGPGLRRVTHIHKNDMIIRQWTWTSIEYYMPLSLCNKLSDAWTSGHFCAHTG